MIEFMSFTSFNFELSTAQLLLRYESQFSVSFDSRPFFCYNTLTEFFGGSP